MRKSRLVMLVTSLAVGMSVFVPTASAWAEMIVKPGH